MVMRARPTALVLGVAIVGTALFGGGLAATAAEKEKLRVGTFDSRAIAAVYAASDFNNAYVKRLKQDYDQAKTAGDKAKLAEIEAEANAHQDRLHQQGFGTASVADILEHVKDKLPGIAKEAGVDAIVSKWDIAYRAPAVEFVDVTPLLIKPFQPNERTLRIIGDLSKKPPVPAKELKKIRD
jgi:hypothetical protein